MSHQWNKPADFPAINPTFANKRSRFIYAGGSSGSRKFLPYFPFDSIVKVDVSDGTARRWSCEGRKFVGEPVFIPTGGGEDHGYVILVEVRTTHMRVPTLKKHEPPQNSLKKHLHHLMHLSSFCSMQYLKTGATWWCWMQEK
jgi:hypothetical protein